MSSVFEVNYHILPVDSINEETDRLQDACRLCLKEGSKYSVSVFAKDASLLKYSEIVKNLMNMIVTEDDNLPKYICRDCATKLSQFYRFKQKCELSECTLSALLVCQHADNLNLTSKVKLEVHRRDCDNVEEPDTCPQINAESCDNEDVDQSDFDVTPVPIPSSCDRFEPAKKKCSTQVIHQCQQCGQVFTRKASLVQHSTTHSNEKQFSCKLCDQRFTRKRHVTLHMRRHTNSKPYVCVICETGFIKSSDLCRHKKIHSERRDYICEVCGMTFKRSSDVKSHMNTHTGNKPYKCKNCTKAYTSHSSMMKHCRKYGHL